MKYIFRENLASYTGVVSNLHGFLNRNLDTGFKSKWSGYWAPPYKYLDYYAIKINGIWLDGGNVKATEYGDQSIIHYYENDTLSITEKVVVPEDLPGFRIELDIVNNTDEPKAVHGTLEMGVDIRPKSQDLGPTEYDIEIDDGLKISHGDRFLKLASDIDADVEPAGYMKQHYPGELQRCFVPVNIGANCDVQPHQEASVELVFTTDHDTTAELERFEQRLDGDLGRAFNDSVDSMLNLVYNSNGKGVIAGHPWFQSYWARDAFWTLLGLIDAGYFDVATETLENFVDHDMTGQIELAEEEVHEFPRDDTYPLFIIAADKLRRHHGLTQKIEEGVERAMQHLELEDNLVENDPMGTWMDTIERPKANDVQSLWLKAAEITDNEHRDDLETGLEEFVDDDFMKDHLGEGTPRAINCAVPLMFGQIEQKTADRYLQKINAEFSSRYGARTRSMADPGYESDGYHTGSVWGLTTGWTAAANLQYGKTRQGINFLEKMAQFIDRDQPGALPEVVDAETGENLGCPEQAWSAGMFVHTIDSYLLGVTVRDGKVEIDPVEHVTYTRTGKRVLGETIDFKVEDGEVELLNEPDIEVVY